jgi:hypothetical protein
VGDADIGEMFLHFFMDKCISPFLGVDLTPFIGEYGDCMALWYHWGWCGFGFQPPPFVVVQTMAWLEEVIKGDQSNINNVFWWDICITIPGSED